MTEPKTAQIEAATKAYRECTARAFEDRIRAALEAAGIDQLAELQTENERLKQERDQFAEQAASRDQRDTDMQQIMGINNQLRARVAELEEAIAQRDSTWNAAFEEASKEIRARTIERCAQAIKNFTWNPEDQHVAEIMIQEIRALKPAGDA